MPSRIAAGSLLACLLLMGCGGGMEVGGAGLSPSAETAVGDDPQDDGAINEGVGDVIE